MWRAAGASRPRLKPASWLACSASYSRSGRKRSSGCWACTAAAAISVRVRARQRGLGVVQRVDVALLSQHRLAIGRHQQRAKRVPAHAGRAHRHLVGSAQMAKNWVVVHEATGPVT